jgi:hypothetical protein
MLLKKISKAVICCSFVIVGTVVGQEINWHSLDQGGGTSSDGKTTLTGVIGQVETIRMEGGSVTVSSGYLPLPADLIFENKFN